MRQTFPKKEKLKSKKQIALLFSEGKAITAYPLRMVYTELVNKQNDVPFKVGVSVSKRLHKKAVDRNRIKRLMREAYRLNKQIIFEQKTNKQYAMMFLYLSKDKFEFKSIEIKMTKLLSKFTHNLKSNL